MLISRSLVILTDVGKRITEPDEIPEGWKIRKFQDVLATVKGNLPINLLKYNEGGKLLPYLSADHLRGNLENVKYCLIDNEKRITIVDKDDIIVIWDGSNAGEFFLGMKGVLSSTMAKVTIKDERLSRKFVYYLLKNCQDTLKRSTKGSTIPHVDGNVLSSMDMPIPSMGEQQKIAEILTTADETIQKVSEQITLTEQLKKGLVQNLLTRGIGHTRFQGTEMGEIPEDWKFENLVNICLKEKGSIISGPFGSNIGKRFFVESGVPVIRGNNLTKYSTQFIDEGFVFVTPSKAEELGTWAIEEDLVFTAAGTLGQVGIIPKDKKYDKYIISNKQLRARIDKNKVNPLYAYYWFKSDTMVSYIKLRNSGSTIPLITLSILRSLPITVPPLEEQDKIVHVLSTIDQKLKLLGDKKQKLVELKKGLMDDLLTGKMRVKV